MSCVTVSSCLAANTGMFLVATDSAIIIFYKQQLPFLFWKTQAPGVILLKMNRFFLIKVDSKHTAETMNEVLIGCSDLRTQFGILTMPVVHALL